MHITSAAVASAMHRALAPFEFAQEPAKSERDQRAKQGDRPAGDGANGPVLKQRFGNQSLQYDARQQSMSRDAHLVPEFDGRGADEDSLSCRPRGVERAFEHIRKADARNGLRFDAEIDQVALRSVLSFAQQPPGHGRDHGSCYVLSEIEVADQTVRVRPYIGGHQCRVLAEQGKGLDDVLSLIGFAAVRAKDRKRYPLGSGAREGCGKSSIVLGYLRAR